MEDEEQEKRERRRRMESYPAGIFIYGGRSNKMLCGELDATSAGIRIFLLLDVIFTFLRHFPLTNYKSEQIEQELDSNLARWGLTEMIDNRPLYGVL